MWTGRNYKHGRRRCGEEGGRGGGGGVGREAEGEWEEKEEVRGGLKRVKKGRGVSKVKSLFSCCVTKKKQEDFFENIGFTLYKKYFFLH